MSFCRRCGKCCHIKREWIRGELINSDPCPYLAHWEGVATCMIYNNRPDICERYFCEEQPLTPNKKWNSKGLVAELRKLADEKNRTDSRQNSKENTTGPS